MTRMGPRPRGRLRLALRVDWVGSPAEGEMTEELASMKAQVYKDPRPKEYFDRFHERARTREPDWVYEVVRVMTSLYAWTFFRARGIAAENVPDGPVIIAPNHFSFMDHFFVGAFIRRRVGFMAKSQLFARPMQWVYTHGGVFPVRRGYRDEEAFITANAILAARRADRHVLRGRALADGQALRAAQARHRAAGAGVRRDGRAGRDPRLLEGAQLEAPAVPQGHRAVRRADALGGGRGADRPTSSSRSRTRSSPRSAASTRAWTARPQGRRAVVARGAPTPPAAARATA